MKKLKQVYIVYVIIVITFVIYLVANTIRFINIQPLDGYTLESIYRSVFVYGVFRLLPLFSAPIVAIFYRNRFTFLILLIYFYFFITQIISFLFSIELDTYSLFFVALIIMPAFLIYLLNRKHTYREIYKLEKKSIMLYNLIASIIAFGISLYLVIKNNSHYYENLQF
jgi:hypothetical protein